MITDTSQNLYNYGTSNTFIDEDLYLIKFRTSGNAKYITIDWNKYYQEYLLLKLNKKFRGEKM